MKIRRSALKDLVTVETLSGDGGFGPIFGAPVNIMVNVDQTRRLVRGTNGEQVVSESTLQVHPQTKDGLDTQTLFTPESRVTIDGRTALVISAKANTARGRVVFLTVTTT